jgi:hypothetical protein
MLYDKQIMLLYIISNRVIDILYENVIWYLLLKRIFAEN